jgi:hypothetical protein
MNLRNITAIFQAQRHNDETYRRVEAQFNVIFIKWMLVVSCTLRPLHPRRNSSQYPLIRLCWPTKRPVRGGGVQYPCRKCCSNFHLTPRFWHCGILQDLTYLLLDRVIHLLSPFWHKPVILLFTFCPHLFIFKSRKSFSACRIWGSHGRGYEEFCLQGYDGLHAVMSQTVELFILCIFQKSHPGHLQCSMYSGLLSDFSLPPFWVVLVTCATTLTFPCEYLMPDQGLCIIFLVLGWLWFAQY